MGKGEEESDWTSKSCLLEQAEVRVKLSHTQKKTSKCCQVKQTQDMDLNSKIRSLNKTQQTASESSTAKKVLQQKYQNQGYIGKNNLIGLILQNRKWDVKGRSAIKQLELTKVCCVFYSKPKSGYSFIQQTSEFRLSAGHCRRHAESVISQPWLCATRTVVSTWGGGDFCPPYHDNW